MTIEGKQAIIKLFEKADAESVQLTWEPINGDIAKSGDMGFTYGIYTLKNDTTSEQGTYVSVWKKKKWRMEIYSGHRQRRIEVKNTKIPYIFC